MPLLLNCLPPLRARMAWQSAGRTDEAWLGPPLEEVLEEIGTTGEKAVLVVPFGFVSDHLEILYDVDIEARAFASERGLQLERTDSPDTDPGFIDAMAAAGRAAGHPSSRSRSGESPTPVILSPAPCGWVGGWAGG